MDDFRAPLGAHQPRVSHPSRHRSSLPIRLLGISLRRTSTLCKSSPSVPYVRHIRSIRLYGITPGQAPVQALVQARNCTQPNFPSPITHSSFIAIKHTRMPPGASEDTVRSGERMCRSAPEASTGTGTDVSKGRLGQQGCLYRGVGAVDAVPDLSGPSSGSHCDRHIAPLRCFHIYTSDHPLTPFPNASISPFASSTLTR